MFHVKHCHGGPAFGHDTSNQKRQPNYAFYVFFQYVMCLLGGFPVSLQPLPAAQAHTKGVGSQSRPPWLAASDNLHKTGLSYSQYADLCGEE